MSWPSILAKPCTASGKSRSALNCTGCLWLNVSSRRVRDAARWLAWAMRARDSPAERRSQRFAAQQVRMALDDRQQVVELVRDAGGQAADRFQLLRLAQLPFQLQALRHVLNDQQPARPGGQRDRLRPKHRITVGAVAAPEHAGAIADSGFGSSRFGWLRFECPFQRCSSWSVCRSSPSAE